MRATRRRPAGGFTVTEVLMAAVIISILVSAAVLPQLRTLEAGKRRAALDVLNAIHAGERVYAIANSDRFCSAPLAGAGSCSWDLLFVDDPANALQNVTFSAVANNAVVPRTVVITATRTAGRCNGRTVTLNQARVVGGTWPANGAC